MKTYFDCGMHLVFHGIVAYCVEQLEAFIKDHGMRPVFLQRANGVLLNIADILLEWCKTKPLPKKLWLGENELALSRIMPYVYGEFFPE